MIVCASLWKRTSLTSLTYCSSSNCSSSRDETKRGKKASFPFYIVLFSSLLFVCVALEVKKLRIKVHWWDDNWCEKRNKWRCELHTIEKCKLEIWKLFLSSSFCYVSRFVEESEGKVRIRRGKRGWFDDMYWWRDSSVALVPTLHPLNWCPPPLSRKNRLAVSEKVVYICLVCSKEPPRLRV